RIGFATAVFESGSVIGVVLTYILIPYARSWRFLFIIVAVIALLSLIMVSLLLPRNPKVEYRYLERNRGSVVKDIGYSKLFRNTIIIFFAFLFALQPWAFYTSWLSTFLVEKFVVELEDIWIPISIFLVIGMAFGILSSILSDKIHSLKGRKTILVLTLVATSIALFMLTVVEPGIYTWIFLAVSIISHRTFLPLAWTIINDTTPDKFVGLVSGVNALAGQISMMITPIIIAYTRESLRTFNISILLLSIFTATSIPLYLQLKPIETTQ
ncbi:MAG: MFS transporter, partial [Ignisphaera sp.]